MRTLILVAGAALALSACGNNDQADNSQNIDENLGAENIVANDVTAIDAVTADAANMAADVNYTEADTNIDNESGAPAPAKRPAAKPAPAARTPDEAVTNTASNATE